MLLRQLVRTAEVVLLQSEGWCVCYHLEQTAQRAGEIHWNTLLCTTTNVLANMHVVYAHTQKHVCTQKLMYTPTHANTHQNPDNEVLMATHPHTNTTNFLHLHALFLHPPSNVDTFVHLSPHLLCCSFHTHTPFSYWSPSVKEKSSQFPSHP